MQVPILKQGSVLIASIQEAMSDMGLSVLRDELATQVGKCRSLGLIIDVKALDVIDSFASRTLHGIAQTMKLRGVATVIVGIQPEVAFAMAQMGLTLGAAETALDLEEGLVLLNLKKKKDVGRGD